MAGEQTSKKRMVIMIETLGLTGPSESASLDNLSAEELEKKLADARQQV